MDRILLSAALIAASILTYTTRQVSHAHAHLGIAIAAVCYVSFAFEISRFVAWEFGSNGAIVGTVLIDILCARRAPHAHGLARGRTSVHADSTGCR